MKITYFEHEGGIRDDTPRTVDVPKSMLDWFDGMYERCDAENGHLANCDCEY